MKIKKVPKEILFFFEKSNEPWGIKDKKSRFIYTNKAYLDFLDIPVCQRNDIYEKSYDFIPHLQPLINDLVQHDQEVMNTEKRCEAVGTLLLKNVYKTFIFEKWPYYSNVGEVKGTIVHMKIFKRKSMAYLIDKPFYGEVTHCPPTNIFSPREWDVLFLLFRRVDNKKISKILNLKETSVRNLISRLLLRTGFSGKEELLNHGLFEGWHLYIPPIFSDIGYNLLKETR